MIMQTDIHYENNIWLSVSARYNMNYNPSRALEIAQYIKSTIQIYRQLMDLPSDLKFRIAPIKSRRKNGQYVSRMKTVEIDPRCDGDFREVIAHELVHAEQFHKGTLVWNQAYVWKGVVHYSKGTTYASYRKLPWEKEAFDRQQGLVKHVAFKLQSR